MVRKFMQIALAGAAALLCSLSAAQAACGPVTGSGQAANPQNFDPPRRYDVVTLAKVRAVGAWKAAVRARCPGQSLSWTRALKRDLSCEGKAGGTSCVATGTPR